MSTIDVSKKSSSFFYINLEQRGVRDAENEQNCIIERNYNVPVIQKASQWVITCERFCIPLQRLSMVLAGTADQGQINAPNNPLNIRQAEGICFTVYNKNNNNPISAHSIPVDMFSMQDFLTRLNSLNVQNGAANTRLEWKVKNGGKLVATWDWTGVYLVLSKTLAEIMDAGTTANLINYTLGADVGIAGIQDIEGDSPIFDRIDRIDRVQLRLTGIPVKSEIIDADDNKTRANVLADMILDNEFSYTFIAQGPGGNANAGPGYQIHETGRNNLLFDSTHRAKCTMLSFQDIPITNILIEAVAILKTGGETKIQIPPNTRFSVKIGFYAKT